MGKLIEKIKSWFLREDESQKLFRIALYLCKKYKLEYGYISVTVDHKWHKKTSPNPEKVCNIYTDVLGHTNSIMFDCTFDNIIEAFELKLKEWKLRQEG